MNKILLAILLSSCVSLEEERHRIFSLEHTLSEKGKEIREMKYFVDFLLCKGEIRSKDWTAPALCNGALFGCLNNMDSVVCDPNLLQHLPRDKHIPSIGSCPSLK